MKNSLILTAILLLCIIGQVSAETVSVEKAKTVAVNFLKNVDSRVNSSSIEVVYTRENAFYIYGYTSGWVIVSADNRVMPIIGYSTEGIFIVPENEADTSRGNKL